MHPMEVIQIPKSHQKSLAALGHRKGINTMQKLVPTLVERREGGAPMWETILQTEGRVTSARMEEHVNRDMDNYHRGMSRYLANSMNTMKRTEGDLRGHVLGVFARSTFTPLRDPTTRHTYNIRDHASTKSATDGSFKDGQAGYGIFSATQNKNLASTLPGKQSIDRAEAFAVLADLLTTPAQTTQHEIVIDSQSTIDAIYAFMQDGERDQRMYRTLANYSVVKAIGIEIQNIHARGGSVTLTKVKSHTGAQDTNSIMNEHADHLAEQGRIRGANSTEILGECFHSLATESFSIE